MALEVTYDDWTGRGTGMEPIPPETWSDVDPELVIAMLMESLTPEGVQIVAKHSGRLSVGAIASLGEPIISGDLQTRIAYARTQMMQRKKETELHV